MFQKREARGRSYQVFTPTPCDPNQPLPLVVFLNGVGENGIDGHRHLECGLPFYLKANSGFPAVVVAPQCKGPWKWIGDEEQALLGAVDATTREWNIDFRRIYLTGLSQGGCETFDLGAKYPDRWSALVVICGAGYKADAPRIKAPIWIFHGERDPLVPPSGRNSMDKNNIGGRDMAKLIRHARYTEFKGADHFIWDRVYADPALWAWLFAQRR